ncbi:hypothetical protein Efla_004880 [Eimeria flavescens]
MARPRRGGRPLKGVLFVQIPFITFSLSLPASSLAAAAPPDDAGPMASEDRVPHFHTYTVEQNVGGIDKEASAQWMELNAHLSLLKLSLPATYMSTLTDVNAPHYLDRVETQDLSVRNQLKDGVRMLDVRLWRGQGGAGQQAAWFTEVPWRLSQDAELLRPNHESLVESLSPPAAAALEIHSRLDLEESLFKPVSNFLKKSISEVVVVVFSAVNGNMHTTHNEIAEGSELGPSLKHAKPQLDAFLQGRGHSGDGGEADAEASGSTRASRRMRVFRAAASISPLSESFVRKSVTFEDFAEITELIDTHWGELLPRHEDSFLSSETNSQVSMRDSANHPEAFRRWQRSQGASLLASSIAKLRDQDVRLLLLVDDPLLAWFITSRSFKRVIALVKADHLYDISYKSESHFIPCAWPHTTVSGKPVLSTVSSWPDCRAACINRGPQECLSWMWKPEASTGSREVVRSSRAMADLGSTWEDTADKAPGKCKLFKRMHLELEFEAALQNANCPYTDLHSSDRPWNPMAVIKDIMRSMLPLVPAELPARFRSRKPGTMPDIIITFDPQLYLLTADSGGAHEAKYGVSQKLLRVVFAPPTAQVYPGLEATQRAAHSSLGDAVKGFNAALADLVVGVAWIFHTLGKEGVGSRTLNAIQIAQYHRLRSNQMALAAANFFEHVMILNPSGAINSHQLAFPVRLVSSLLHVCFILLYGVVFSYAERDCVDVFPRIDNNHFNLDLRLHLLVWLPSRRPLAEDASPPCAHSDQPCSGSRGYWCSGQLVVSPDVNNVRRSTWDACCS